MLRYIFDKIYCESTELHEKNDFAEIFKNFARYTSENNFIKLSKL